MLLWVSVVWSQLWLSMLTVMSECSFRPAVIVDADCDECSFKPAVMPTVMSECKLGQLWLLMLSDVWA